MEFSIALLFLCVVLGTTSADSKSKIHPKVSASLAASGSSNIFVTFREPPSAAIDSLKHPPGISDGERRNAVRKALIKHASKSQKDATRHLDSHKIPYKRFWITNEVYVKGATASHVEALANIPNVKSIRQEGNARLPETIKHTEPSKHSRSQVGWNMIEIGAPDAWAKGHIGTGSTAGSIDSGVRWTHQDLSSNYRSDYGWRDCTVPTSSSLPTDDVGHGTQVMSVIVGANGTGVAPGAKWITCKAFDATGFGLESWITCCGEFMYCPTQPDGTNSDCTKAPDFVNNSWFVYNHDTWFDPIIKMWNKATPPIISVYAAGDLGEQGCSSLDTPADSKEKVFAVGAINESRVVPDWSARGPVGTKIKPDVAAPGTNILTASNTGDTDYAIVFATSYAAPHMTGALLLRDAQYPITSYAGATHIILEACRPTTEVANPAFCGGTSQNGKLNCFSGDGVLNVRNI